MNLSGKYLIAGGLAVGLGLVWLTTAPCGPFPDARTSPYRLPFPIGTSYNLGQCNCTNGGHKGAYQYAYDFDMPIGTEISAARAGKVAAVNVSFMDGDFTVGHENWIKIRHEDGTFAHYSHLTHNGAVVQVGDSVVAGQIIGHSGNTGNTGGRPHLHFGVHQGLESKDGESIPVSFSNVAGYPERLTEGRVYTALAIVPKSRSEPLSTPSKSQ